MPQFPKASERALTPDGYRRAAKRCEALAATIARYSQPTDAEQSRKLARAVRALAYASSSLLSRMKENCT